MIDEIHAHNFYKLDINCRAFSILKGGPKNLTGHVWTGSRCRGEVRLRNKRPPMVQICLSSKAMQGDYSLRMPRIYLGLFIDNFL
jgi:hypothetical protein